MNVYRVVCVKGDAAVTYIQNVVSSTPENAIATTQAQSLTDDGIPAVAPEVEMVFPNVLVGS
jgi:hypothetical protein